MKLVFLGGCRQVGKSCVLAQLSEVKIFLDCGLKIHDGNEYPEIKQYKYDACVVTHAHVDHSGFLPGLYRHGDVPVFATFPTIPITNLLLEDSEKVALRNKQSIPFKRTHVKKLNKKFFPLGYNKEYEFFDETRFRLLDAGHIAGSAQVLLENKATHETLLYTGDFNISETRMHSPAQTPHEKVDVLVIESTYANRDHAPRAELEKKFCDAVQDCVDNDCTAVVPCFAVGRTQEILQVLYANHVRSEVWVDGMGKKVSAILHDFPSYVKNSGMLNNALQKAKPIETREQRRLVTKKPCVIVSTAGMLDGGPALSFIQALNNKGNGAIFLTGFQVPGTNGARLLEGKKIRVNDGARLEKIGLPAHQFDFSAHSGRSQLFDYIKRLNPRKVFCMHGDEEVCIEFARELSEDHGFDAVAPKEGEKFQV